MACCIMLWSYRRAIKGLKDKLDINWLPCIYVLFWAGCLINIIIIAKSLNIAIDDVLNCD